MGCKIIGTGSYLPERVVYNHEINVSENYAPDMQEFFDGIDERRHASARENSVFMGTQSAKMAIDKAGLKPQDIDLSIVYSVFNDFEYPKDGNFIAANLGLTSAVTMHVDTACSSSLTMLKTASAFIESGMHKNVLLTAITNWVGRGVDQTKDYSSLGDAAASVVLTASTQQSLIGFKEEARADLADVITMKSPCATKKHETIEFGKTDQSREYFKVGALNIAKELMAEKNLFPRDIDWAVFHQAGKKLLDIWYEALEFPIEKGLNTVKTVGNISAANNFYNLNYFTESGIIKRGDKILLFSPASGIHNITIIWEY